MVHTFAKRMTDLRRKKGITQKQAAKSLGVSQALLSHYENGVRECGLEFLVKAASFYEVSCDYLLGKEKKDTRSLTPAMKEKMRLRAAGNIIFDLLEQAQSPQLLEQASDFLCLSYYRLYRRLYCCGHATQGEFKGSDYTFRAHSDAAMQVAEAQLRCVLAGQDIGGGLQEINRQALMTDRETLGKIYGNDYILMEQLVKRAEKQFKDR